MNRDASTVMILGGESMLSGGESMLSGGESMLEGGNSWWGINARRW